MILEFSSLKPIYLTFFFIWSLCRELSWSNNIGHVLHGSNCGEWAWLLRIWQGRNGIHTLPWVPWSFQLKERLVYPWTVVSWLPSLLNGEAVKVAFDTKMYLPEGRQLSSNLILWDFFFSEPVFSFKRCSEIDILWIICSYNFFKSRDRTKFCLP